jgi:Flp pilus assembly secretin CpaC
MRAPFAPRAGRLWLCPALGIVAAALAAFADPGAGVAAELSQSTLRDPVVVHLDQAKLLQLPERTATLVIGNPLIADAVVQGGSTMVVTGKSYGMTNLIALDRAGATISEFPIQVTGPNDQTVVMYRGVERETYSCAPKCERRITLGDSQPYFTTNLQTLGTFNAQAQPSEKK